MSEGAWLLPSFYNCSRAMALAAVLSASGCAQMAPQVLLSQNTRDDRQAYIVKCGDSAYSMGACYEQARTLCGTNGFDILRRQESRDQVLSMEIACRP